VPGYFVTGTDTGVGKTEVALGLMQLLQDGGRRVLGMKPVACGASPGPTGLRNADALRLQAQGSHALPYEQVNPYVFVPPVAPTIAARQAGVTIELAQIASDLQTLADTADEVIVEGIGGWQAPLNDRATVADLAAALGLPVVLVVGLRLGCISHALLSCESIARHQLAFAGWIANAAVSQAADCGEVVASLRARIAAPLLGVVPHLEQPDSHAVARHLALP